MIKILLCFLLLANLAAANVVNRIDNRVKDEFGWDKELVKKRLAEGVYTETGIKEFKKQASTEEIKAEVIANKIVPVQIEIIKIEIEKIIVAGIRTRDITTWLKQVQGIDLENLVLYTARIATKQRMSLLDELSLRKAFKSQNYKQVQEILENNKIESDISDAILQGVIPKTQPFFIDATFGENAYLFRKNMGRIAENGDVLIVDVSDIVNRAKFAESVKRNKGKRYAIQLGLGAMNNKDNPKSEWAEIAKQFKEFYILAKSIDPNVVVGITVCAAGNWREWREIFDFQSDILFVWNLYKMYFNPDAIKRQFGADVVIAGMNAMGHSKETSNPAWYIKKVRKAGFSGSIWYNFHP